MEKIKELLNNMGVRFALFMVLFMLIGLSTYVFEWMAWPALIFYIGIFLLVAVVVIRAGILSFKSWFK